MFSVEVKNISKKYLIFKNQSVYLALRDKLTYILKNPIKGIRVIKKTRKEDFYAIKNISFKIEEGETIGVIGENGAGKSTLLKILSGITPLTSGEIKIRGKVTSILEIGTGFHPELTGRENIYLNAAILGMPKKEVANKFKDIVEFSGVENFLDTPVKRYSSGMYVRLAFSVAAHMEPDILLIDEVLAVGDFEFQKKCLGKLGEFNNNHKRTVFFVSHDMGAIKNVCKKTMLIKGGEIVEFGDTGSVVEKYLNSGINEEPSLINRKDRQGTGEITLSKIFFTNSEGVKTKTFLCGHEALINLEYINKGVNKNDLVNIYIGINTFQGSRLVILSNKYTGEKFEKLSEKGIIRCKIPTLPFLKNSYSLGVTITVNNETSDNIVNAASFDVENSDFYKINPEEILKGDRGHLILSHSWEIL